MEVKTAIKILYECEKIIKKMDDNPYIFINLKDQIAFAITPLQGLVICFDGDKSSIKELPQKKSFHPYLEMIISSLQQYIIDSV